MSVHYKFKSALEYDTVTFDGLHISVRDLKNSIMQQKRIGKNTDFDLQVTNAQTKEIYDNDESLIPKNTSLLIARIPSIQSKPKTWEGYGGNSSPITKIDDGGPISKAMDLSSLDASEEDKIKAMMSQSTQDYDPSNYLKIRGANQMGAVPPNYRCFKCHQGGHWIKDCPLSQGTEPIEIKKSTGIPRSFMVPVEGPQVPGAMMTPNGSFAVPVLDHKAYTEKPQPAPIEEKRPEIPEDLLCSLCSDLLLDAVMIPCCGDSYCDECIRSCLLESEDHECPACHEKDISPGTLIPNRYLRNSVANFKSTTGYVKRLVYKRPATPTKEADVEIDTTKEISSTEIIKELSPQPAVKPDSGEKTIIREADSTESQKTTVKVQKEDFTEDIDLKQITNKTSPVPEGPPGVSPRPENSPKAQRITNVTIGRSNRGHSKLGSNERSPRRPHHIQRSPNYQDTMSREDRPGTPTVDEPGIGCPTTMCSTTVYHSAPTHFNAGQVPNVMNPIMGMPPPNIQGPPPIMSNAFPGQPMTASYPPPNPGPPQTFRLPPPGAPPYMGSNYNVPPRPLYDCARPPLAGPSAYPMYPSGPRSSRGRDYSRDIPRRGRTPPRIIDDPLEAFNRMLREKDERERRAKQRKTRSYSRSSSRSFSPSPRRLRSRSPRRRSRSRSRSFSISRSRSRSFSPSSRTSPPRQFSPKRSPHRGLHRYRSPIRSPSRYRFKDQQPIPDRERVRERDLERDRDRDKEFRDRDSNNYSRERERDFRERDHRDRDFGYGGYERDRHRGRQQWGGQSMPRKDYPGPDSYYHPQEMTTQPPPFVPSNRYPPRDVYPQHHMPPMQHQPNQHLPPIRRYDDVAPPGTEQPPIPGLENTPRFDERYSYDHGNRDIHANDKLNSPRSNRDIDKIEKHEHRDDMNLERDRERKHDGFNRSPDRNRYLSPKRTSKERDHRDRATSQEKHKRRRRDESPSRDKRDYDRSHDRKRDYSDEERSKKSKEKKRKKEKREKREEEKKKRKEKKEKREHDKQRKAEEKEKSEKKSKVDSKKLDNDDQDAINDYDNNDGKNIQNKYSDNAKEIDDYNKTKYVDEENTHSYDNSEAINDNKEDSSSDKDKFKKSFEDKQDLIKEENKLDVKPTQKSQNSPNVEENHDLYGDLLTEGIDNAVIENYGKLKDLHDEPSNKNEQITDRLSKEVCRDEGELSYEDDSEKDILELHTNETDLKTELDVKNEVLAPLPERSKWEVDEDAPANSNSAHNRGDGKSERLEKSGKVTNEVLKRAENAIFAKAINAIRPIEIKKISLDRAKLYSGERDRDKKLDDIRDEVRNIQVTISGANSFDDDVVTLESVEVSKPRLSVKERLGCKVDDLDRIVKVEKPYDRNRSRSLSPLSRRAGELNRNLGQGERRIEVDDRKRYDSKSQGDKGRDRHHRSFRSDREPRREVTRRDVRDVKRDFRRDRERDYRKEGRRTERKDVARSRSRGRGSEKSREDDKSSKDKKESNTPSSGHEKDKRKRKDKKEKKKEKTKKHRKDDDDKESIKGNKNENDEKSTKLKSTTEKRKATLDEACFEPDYDLETESEKDDGAKKEKDEKNKKRSVSRSVEDEAAKKKIKVEEKKYESSSSESTDTSTDEERKKKKHRKHKKKKSKKDSSSSSESESDSDSSEEEKDKKKRKHKKKLKKKRKSKHK